MSEIVDEQVVDLCTFKDTGNNIAIEWLKWIDAVQWEKQGWMPDPDLITINDVDYFVFKKDHSHQVHWQQDEDGALMKSGKSPIIQTPYHSLFFFDIKKGCIAEQIIGGEVLVQAKGDMIYCLVQEQVPYYYYKHSWQREKPLTVREEGHRLETKYWLKTFKFGTKLSELEI